jgi:N,N'-diacetyllegionaminate synthase
MGVKRPGSGISPMKWDDYIGKASKFDYDVDDLIRE